MSEHLSHHNRHETGHDAPERAEQAQETHHKHHEAARSPEPKPDVEKLRHKAHEQALSAKHLELPKDEHAPVESFVNKELKEMAYTRLLNRGRRGLSPVGRAMSRVIHQPVVNAVSEVSAKTVGRPSGLLGGGLLALAGTSIYYFITKHYGYEYNNFVFLLLLGGGFLLGWTVELFWRLMKATGRRS